MSGVILTINSGSSSLKLGLYSADAPLQLLYQGVADAIGRPGGALTITDAAGNAVHREDAAQESQSEAFIHAAKKLHKLTGSRPAALGYRIVHGGPHLRRHCRITPQVLATLRGATHYAPLHIPPALALIDTATQLYPDAPAFACFDTAFHATMPPEATTYAIPARFREQGVQRYGFHGLSYESIVVALAPTVPPRLVVAHLGNGASLCAIAQGRSVDTSMGLTPTGGIPMGTRTGDLDPGVVLFLARSSRLENTPGAGNDSTRNAVSDGVNGEVSDRAGSGVNCIDELESVLNRDSGLAGLSSGPHSPGISDMRELTRAADSGDANAALALTIFCRSIAKTVASYAAVLGGLDALVFTGGIGEHSAFVRESVCRQLAFLGIALDADANHNSAAIISQQRTPSPQQIAPPRVLIIPADEDGRIAHHVHHLLTP